MLAQFFAILRKHFRFSYPALWFGVYSPQGVKPSTQEQRATSPLDHNMVLS